MDRTRLQELLRCHFDKLSTLEEQAELEQLLLSHEEARELFWQEAEGTWLIRRAVESTQQESAATGKKPEIKPGEKVFRKPLSNATEPTSFNSAYRFIVQPTPFSIAIAALVMGLIITAMAFVAPPFYRSIVDVDNQESPHPIVATITELRDAPPSEIRRGTQLRAGERLDLVQGLMEVTFHSGARIVVEGPASLHFNSENTCRLEKGRLSGKVPKEAVGFTVSTELADVIDLGTQFGVVFQVATTLQVHVFEGSVAVSRGDNAPQRILAAGEALQIDRKSPNAILLAANESDFRQLRQDDLALNNENWTRFSTKLRKDPDLLAYYTMENLQASSSQLINQSQSHADKFNARLGSPPSRPGVAHGRWPGKRALAFDGKNSYIALEDRDTAAFGLPEYTISVWFMRLGEGQVVTTGGRGVFAVPLVTKGFGAGDREGQDVTFFLGLMEDGRMAADYEDEEGGNHPLVGKQKVALGHWHHAALTCDGKEHRLYLDGKLEASRQVSEPPQLQSRMLAAIGSGVLSNIDRSGFFAGRIDEVAIFQRALSASEISDLATIGNTENQVERD